jgi:hypothetical protein
LPDELALHRGGHVACHRLAPGRVERIEGRGARHAPVSLIAAALQPVSTAIVGTQDALDSGEEKVLVGKALPQPRVARAVQPTLQLFSNQFRKPRTDLRAA